MTVLSGISSLTGALLITMALSAQPSLDSISVKTVRGAIVPFSSIAKNERVILLCFWSVNSDQSVSELNAINAQFEKWKQAASFRLVAVCVDEGNILNRMRPTANMNGWTFDVCGDINGDLRKAFNVNDVLPKSVLLDKGQVVYQQSGFEPGSERYFFSKIQALR
jgi:hypothetical protein